MTTHTLDSNTVLPKISTFVQSGKLNISGIREHGDINSLVAREYGVDKEKLEHLLFLSKKEGILLGYPLVMTTALVVCEKIKKLVQSKKSTMDVSYYLDTLYYEVDILPSGNIDGENFDKTIFIGGPKQEPIEFGGNVGGTESDDDTAS